MIDTLVKCYIDHLERCFEMAEKERSKITEFIRTMKGMTGEKTRHFYNNLLTFPNCRYLEVGSWVGSSVCAGMCLNHATVVCVDNWTEFGGPKEEFTKNFENYKGDNDATFIESNCWDLDVHSIGKFNVFLYDGDHSEYAHYRALPFFMDCLDDVFVYIVDDWNWDCVRKPTLASIRDAKMKVLWEREIRLTLDGTHTPDPELARSTWHNGIYVCLLQKQRSLKICKND